MIYRLERVERNFAHLNFQTSELWLGVRDGDLPLWGHLYQCFSWDEDVPVKGSSLLSSSAVFWFAP